MKIKHISFILLPIFLLTLFSCKTDLDEIRALMHKEELPDVIVENLLSQYSINGNLQVKLISPKANRYTSQKKQYSQFPDGITLMFFDRHMNLHSSLKADYGIYYEKKSFAKAKGNVVLTNTEGSILRTEELLIDEKEEKIYSLVPVKIEDKDGFEITGKGGFESNMDFTVYRFTDVSGRVPFQENINEEEAFTDDEEKKPAKKTMK